jgi:hypothetical protein
MIINYVDRYKRLARQVILGVTKIPKLLVLMGEQRAEGQD